MKTQQQNLKIGFVGLGYMGSGMVNNLIKNGYPLMVYTVDKEKEQKYKDTAAIAKDLTELIEYNDLLMLSLPGSLEVEELMEKFIKSGARNMDIIDTSSSYPQSTIDLAKRLSANNNILLDAPLTGGPHNAAEGTLNIIIGGEKSTYEKHLPVFRSIAKNIFYAGKSGSGNIIKLASNFAAIIQTCMCSEILPFVEKMGVDQNIFFDLLSVSGGNSPVFQLVAPKIINNKFDVSFKLKLAIKDLGYLKKMFDERRAPSFLLDSCFNLQKMAVCKGLEEKDISEMSRVIKDLYAGLKD